jgi:hypothetical protein
MIMMIMMMMMMVIIIHSLEYNRLYKRPLVNRLVVLCPFPNVCDDLW